MLDELVGVGVLLAAEGRAAGALTVALLGRLCARALPSRPCLLSASWEAAKEPTAKAILQH